MLKFYGFLKVFPFKAEDKLLPEISKTDKISAKEIIPDKQGRALIPRYLKEFAGIKKDIVIIGVSNRIEIWSHELWEEYYAKSKDTFEDVAEKLIEE